MNILLNKLVKKVTRNRILLKFIAECDSVFYKNRSMPLILSGSFFEQSNTSLSVAIPVMIVWEDILWKKIKILSLKYLRKF